jgi:hypothetical protein
MSVCVVEGVQWVGEGVQCRQQGEVAWCRQQVRQHRTSGSGGTAAAGEGAEPQHELCIGSRQHAGSPGPGSSSTTMRPHSGMVHAFAVDSSAVAAPPWQHRRGSTAVAAPPWQHRRGSSAVTAPPWQRRRGSTAVAAPPWQHCRGSTAVAAPPWQHSTCSQHFHCLTAPGSRTQAHQQRRSSFPHLHADRHKVWVRLGGKQRVAPRVVLCEGHLHALEQVAHSGGLKGAAVEAAEVCGRGSRLWLSNRLSWQPGGAH